MNRAASALVLLASSLVLAACGGDAVSLDPVAAAATKTSKAGAAKFDMQIEFAVNGQQFHANGGGVAGDDGMQMAIDFADVLRASGQRAAGPAVMKFIADTRSGFVMYIGLPKALLNGGGLPGGKPWMRIDMVRFAERYGLDASQFTSTGSQTPMQAVDQLRASKNSEKVGEETVDGVKTTHYRCTVRTTDVIKQADPARRAELRKLMRGQPKTIRTDVWVDDDDLIRKLTSAYGKVGTATMTFREWGVPFQLDVPPANQTINGNTLIAQQQGR